MLTGTEARRKDLDSAGLPGLVDNCIGCGYIYRRTMPPLTPAVFHILLALAQSERHGYGILKEVQQQTDGAVRLGPGTLYGTLQRLMELGWVEETAAPASATDERRRYYRLTRGGRRALEVEVQRMETLVRSARARRVFPRASQG